MSHWEPFADPDSSLPPLVEQVYGTARFQTGGNVLALTYRPDGGIRTIEESGVLRGFAPDGTAQGCCYLSDSETLWAFAGDPDLLASGSRELILWDIPTGTPHFRTPQESWVTALAFSPDSAWLAVGRDNGTVQVWEILTQRCRFTLKAHPKAVTALAFTPTADALLTTGEDRELRLWQMHGGRCLAANSVPTERLSALFPTPQGDRFFTTGWDGCVRLWELHSLKALDVIGRRPAPITYAALSPTGSRLAAIDTEQTLAVYELDDPKHTVHARTLREIEVAALCFAPSGTMVACAGEQEQIHRIDVFDGEPLGEQSPVGRVRLARCRTKFGDGCAVTTEEGIVLWSEQGERRLFPGCGFRTLASGLHGSILAAGGIDPTIFVHDLATGRIRSLRQAEGPITALACEPTGELIATNGGLEGAVYLHSVRGGSCRTIEDATDGCSIEALVFHPHLPFLVCLGLEVPASGKDAGCVALWGEGGRRRLGALALPAVSAAFVADGTHLLLGSVDGRIIQVAIPSMEVVMQRRGHQGEVTALAVHPNGRHFITTGTDQILRMWDLAEERPKVIRQLAAGRFGLVFSSDGRSLWSAEPSGVLYRYNWLRLLEE